DWLVTGLRRRLAPKGGRRLKNLSARSALAALVLIPLALAVPAVAGQKTPPPQLVIPSTQIVLVSGGPPTILSKGEKFGDRQGRVTLGSQDLQPILSWTATEIEAALPAGLAPGTYKLTVTRGPASTQTFTVDVTIGAQGPPGPPGPPGPTGP